MYEDKNFRIDSDKAMFELSNKIIKLEDLVKTSKDNYLYETVLNVVVLYTRKVISIYDDKLKLEMCNFVKNYLDNVLFPGDTIKLSVNSRKVIKRFVKTRLKRIKLHTIAFIDTLIYASVFIKTEMETLYKTRKFLKFGKFAYLGKKFSDYLPNNYAKQAICCKSEEHEVFDEVKHSETNDFDSII